MDSTGITLEQMSRWNPHRGPGRWLRSYILMFIWEARSLRIVLPLAVVAQIILGAGLVIGFGFLVGDIPMTEALFLATGATVIAGHVSVFRYKHKSPFKGTIQDQGSSPDKKRTGMV